MRIRTTSTREYRIRNRKALASLETTLDLELDNIPDNHNDCFRQIEGISFIVIVQSLWLYESQHLCPPNIEPLYNIFTNEVLRNIRIMTS